MYRYLDQKIAELSRGERLLVWSVRRWFNRRQLKQCPVEPIGAMFAAHHILPALVPFQRLMTLVETHLRLPLSFVPAHPKRVSEGEAIIISMIANIFRQSPTQSGVTASLIVTCGQIDEFMHATVCLAKALAAAGLSTTADLSI